MADHDETVRLLREVRGGIVRACRAESLIAARVQLEHWRDVIDTYLARQEPDPLGGVTPAEVREALEAAVTAGRSGDSADSADAAMIAHDLLARIPEPKEEAGGG